MGDVWGWRGGAGQSGSPRAGVLPGEGREDCSRRRAGVEPAGFLGCVLAACGLLPPDHQQLGGYERFLS